MASTNRIDATFARLRAQRRAAFVAYICAGDPNPELSLEVCRTLIDEGTDILEIGMPFSDPLADGLTNQLAAERALAAGATQASVFELVRQIRSFSDLPIVLYTYFNLVFNHGTDAFVQQAVAAGVDGLLTLDLPPEEAAELDAACQQHGLRSVYIIAPTTPDARIPIITNRATGFIYYVSREGVTGVRDDVASDLSDKLAAIRRHTRMPVVVGFGISEPAHVRTVAAVADGVVVGSALVNCVARHADEPASLLAALRSKARELVSAITPRA